MAARNFTDEVRHLQRGVTHLFCKATCSAPSGSDTTATLAQNAGKGVASVVQAETGAGVITITLTDKYKTFLGLRVTPVDAGTVDDWVFIPTAVDVASAKTITLAAFKDGAAADVPNTCPLYLEIILSDSSV
jgi:hypothetical protein